MADEAVQATEEAATTTEETAPRKSGIFNRDKYNYTKNGVKTSSGRPAVDNGDAVAVALRNKDADACVALVAENGVDVPARWAELNVGMRRMNASNVLRRLAKTEEGVLIDGQRIKLEPKVMEEVSEAA